MMSKRFNFLLAVCSAVLLFSCSNLNAQEQFVLGDRILLDFGATAPSAMDAPGFQQIGAVIGATNLLNSEGQETVVNLEIDGTGNNGNFAQINTTTGFEQGPTPASTSASVFTDGIRTNVGNFNTPVGLDITFTGLDATGVLTYELFGGFLDSNDNTAATYSVGGDSRRNEIENGVVDSFETFSNLTANSDGEITLSIDNIVGTSFQAIVSELTLTATAPATAVPEPSSIAVLAMGVVGLIARRRRVA